MRHRKQRVLLPLLICAFSSSSSALQLPDEAAEAAASCKRQRGRGPSVGERAARKGVIAAPACEGTRLRRRVLCEPRCKLPAVRSTSSKRSDTTNLKGQHTATTGAGAHQTASEFAAGVSNHGRVDSGHRHSGIVLRNTQEVKPRPNPMRNRYRCIELGQTGVQQLQLGESLLQLAQLHKTAR